MAKADPDCECCLGGGLQADGETACPCAVSAETNLLRDLADCLEDMTKHYVEVRNDLYGFEASEEIEVVAASKLIFQARARIS